MRKADCVAAIIGALLIIAIVLWCFAAIIFDLADYGVASGQQSNDDVSNEVPAPVPVEPQGNEIQREELPEPEPLPQPEEQVQHLYTEEDAVALAKMAWGEARGVYKLRINGKTISRTCQKAATMWCALNRYDAGFEDSIAEVIAAPMQFVGYAAGNPIEPDLLALAYDVLERWERERLHGGDVGRVLPAEYMWFTGDGRHNWFASEWRSAERYTWELPDPYEED